MRRFSVMMYVLIVFAVGLPTGYGVGHSISSFAISQVSAEQVPAQPKKDPAPTPIPAPTPDAPYLTLPATVSVEAPDFLVLTANTNIKNITWDLDGLAILPSPTPNTVYAFLKKAGTYRLIAAGAVSDKPFVAKCTLTVTVPAAPAPTPPDPTPVVPTDPLTKALQSAYSADSDSDKVKSLGALQGAYKTMAANVASQSFKTNADAQAWIKTSIATVLIPTQIVNTRKAIAAEMSTVFGTGAGTAVDMSTLASELSKISTSLNGVK